MAHYDTFFINYTTGVMIKRRAAALDAAHAEAQIKRHALDSGVLLGGDEYALGSAPTVWMFSLSERFEDNADAVQMYDFPKRRQRRRPWPILNRGYKPEPLTEEELLAEGWILE